MLPKHARLAGAKFRAEGYRTVATPYFSLKARRNGEERDRIGVVAGVAVHKSAVKRNFWKRQAREELAGRPGADKKGAGRDLLIIFSRNVNTLTKKQFKEKLAEALVRIEV